MAQPSHMHTHNSFSVDEPPSRSGQMAHDPPAPQVPSSYQFPPALFLAGVLIQLGMSRWMSFILWGNNQGATAATSMTTALDLELAVLGILSSFFRSILSMILLVVLRQWVFANNNNSQFGARVFQDLCFHMQCRFLVCSILCVAPSSIPPAVVDLAVLVVSTCSQRAVRQYCPSDINMMSIRQDTTAVTR